MLAQALRRILLTAAPVVVLGTAPSMAFDPAHLEELNSTSTCRECDLSGIDLTGAELREFYFWGSDLTEAVFVGANLKDAGLVKTNLTRANLTDAALHDAYLIDAQLMGASMAGANLSGANMLRADLTDADLTGAILCRTKMPDGSIDNSGC